MTYSELNQLHEHYANSWCSLDEVVLALLKHLTKQQLDKEIEEESNEYKDLMSEVR